VRYSAVLAAVAMCAAAQAQTTPALHQLNSCLNGIGIAQAGMQSEYSWAANFAPAGIVALVVDPLGQGGAVMSGAQFRAAAGAAFQSKRQAVRVLARKAGEPLPFE
jgi:hypothetical protein